MVKFLFFISAMIMFSGCNTGHGEYKLLGTKNPENINSRKVTSRSIEYRILKQDRLEVILYKDPNQESIASNELGQKMNSNGILVDTHGNITLPLIGKVSVAGLTQTQAADRITLRLKKYLNNPSVYLEVLNKRLFVLGEVKTPGPVNIDKEKMTLFEALAFAGDLTDAAVRNNIIIMSNDKDGMHLRSVDLTNFDTMNYSSLMLRPNDIVYVQPSGWKEFKVATSDITPIFSTITTIAAPFVTLKYLSD